MVFSVVLKLLCIKSDSAQANEPTNTAEAETMNIFILSLVISECVKAMADVHLVKMPLESAQMLYAAHHKHEEDKQRMLDTAPATKANTGKPGCGGMRLTHQNHPCTQWVQACPANYHYLVELALAMMDEYAYRRQYAHPDKEYHYPHNYKHICWLRDNLPRYPKHTLDAGMSPFPQAVRQWIQELNTDVVTAYQLTYIHEKEGNIRNFKWTGRPRPRFMDDLDLLLEGEHQREDVPALRKRAKKTDITKRQRQRKKLNV